jgi:hypothetical protein
MAENKTKPTKVSVAGFLKSKARGQQLADCQELVKLFKKLTGKAPRMWGPSIVGFDSYHYVYESGREGDAPLAGFSPRGKGIVVYVWLDRKTRPLLARLGKHRSTVSCVYFKKLDDLDRGVLEELTRASIDQVRRRYPG